ncbi:MAG TPA: condensation domain-containing protein, partial [Pyrinomonadaceae bacterium]|nr:condensation domain-containing protein [Pyrinomonadaceae bacterium]
MQEIVEGYELSPQQKELWRVMQTTAGEQLALECEVRVDGAVDRVRLDHAVQQVLARHEILRTSYEQIAGLSYPLQVIGERMANDVLVSWNDVLRIKLGAMSADRQSLHNLVREIAATYAAPEETSVSYLQYADASEIFNELVGSQETRGGREHWERVKADAAAEPELAIARSGTGGGELGQVSFNLRRATQAQLVEFCREHAVSEKAVLLTVWAVLLSRLSAQSHLLLYLLSTGRRHEELVSAVGLFARWLPLALEVEGNFRTALATVSEQVEFAEKWQEYYQAERESGGTVGYSFEFYEWPEAIEAAGLRFVITRMHVRQQRPGLSLSVGWEREATRLELSYDEAVFTNEAAERLSEEYETLLRSALAESAAQLSELDIVGARERDQLLSVMRGPVRQQSRQPVTDGFLTQAQARP